MILGATITGSLTLNGVNLASITGSEASINALNSFTASAATTGSNVFKSNQTVTGSVDITGSLTVVGPITGTVTTASYVLNAVSASYALNATTSSFALVATSASYALASTSASYALASTSASYALVASTASFADTFTVAGTLTAQKLVVQTITSSILYSSGSNIFGNSLSNTQSMTGSLQVTGSTHYLLGNVGIGTVAPSRNLVIQNSSSIVLASLVSNPSNIAYLLFGDTDSDTQGRVQYDNSGDFMQLYTNGSERMRITSSGSVGIGTTAPGAPLSFADTNALKIQLNAGAGNYYGIEKQAAVSGGDGLFKFESGKTSAGEFAFSTGGTTRLTIASTGNVGIAVTPSSWSTANSVKALQIPAGSFWNYENSNLYVGLNYYWDGSNRRYVNNGLASEYQQDGNHIFFTAPTDTAGNVVTLTERMRITSGGNVGIGTTTPLSGVGFGLQITSPLASAAYVRTNYTGFTGLDIIQGGDGTGYLYLRDNTDLRFGTNNTLRLTIASTGAATFSAGISVGAATATTGGIQFPATAVAIADGNNLDDYEEGTWTPGFAFALSTTGITYSVQAGTYTKIGRQVTVNGYIQLSSKGSAPGWAGITGLPFTIANTNGNYSIASIRVSAITYTGSIAGQANINGTVMELNQTTEAGVLSDVTNTNFANNSSILLSLTYFV